MLTGIISKSLPSSGGLPASGIISGWVTVVKPDEPTGPVNAKQAAEIKKENTTLKTALPTAGFFNIFLLSCYYKYGTSPTPGQPKSFSPPQIENPPLFPSCWTLDTCPQKLTKPATLILSTFFCARLSIAQ